MEPTLVMLPVGLGNGCSAGFLNSEVHFGFYIKTPINFEVGFTIPSLKIFLVL